MTTPRSLGDLTHRPQGVGAVSPYVLHKLHVALAVQAHGEGPDVVTLARQHPATRPHVALFEKSATAALLGTDQGLDPLRPLRTDWVGQATAGTFLRMIERDVVSVPALTPVTIVSTGVQAGFITENSAVPVTRPTLSDLTPEAAKLATIIPYSMQALKKSAGQLAVLADRDSARAITTGENSVVLSGSAAVTGGAPAGLLSGVSAIGGGSPSDILADVRGTLEALAGGTPIAPVLVTSWAGALYLSTRRDDGGPLFPNVRVRFGPAGDVFGVPLFVAVGAPDRLIGVDAGAVIVVDEGAELDVAHAGALVFDDAAADGEQSSVSLFQTGAFALRTTRYVAWRLARANAVQYCDLPVEQA